MAVAIHRLGGATGAEIAGVDLSRDLGNEDFSDILGAFHEYSVLVFRNQSLDPDALVRFSERVGPLEQHLLGQFALPENPDVFQISNKTEGGKPTGAIRAGQYWHSDCSYTAHPTMASLLHAKEIPGYGGDTLFAGMAAAYDALSDIMKGMLDGLVAVHDYTNAYETFFSRHAERPPLSDAEKEAVPPVEHPVVRTHPETGRKALYVNPGFTRRITGMHEAESRALLDFLFGHATQPRFIYRHRWAVGDLVMWDNRSTIHLALDDYDMAEPRHLHRTTLAGDRPR
ncbi:MAG: TauD/TfdA family dioxygenase [Alphaproteobacteria bacterium]|nr:TauD/TfdA family dioxygenase [Alphaproteobacteria bacterium]